MTRNRISKSRLKAGLCFHCYMHFFCVPIYIYIYIYYCIYIYCIYVIYIYILYIYNIVVVLININHVIRVLNATVEHKDIYIQRFLVIFLKRKVF